jgi:hypothetical protein
VGTILIAVNPYVVLPGLYTDDIVRNYARRHVRRCSEPATVSAVVFCFSLVSFVLVLLLALRSRLGRELRDAVWRKHEGSH